MGVARRRRFGKTRDRHRAERQSSVGSAIPHYELVNNVHRSFRNIFESAETKEATALAARVRQASPTVYVDGRLVTPLEYRNAARITV